MNVESFERSNVMKTSDFDYHLPESSIAQTPVEPRDSSRLLVVHRDTGELEHRIFRDLSGLLRPNDLLILNQTRVIPARVFARKPTGGRVELLLLRRRDLLRWEALVGGKGLRIGDYVHIGCFSALFAGSGITLEDFSGLSARVTLYSESDDYSGASLTNIW